MKNIIRTFFILWFALAASASAGKEINFKRFDPKGFKFSKDDEITLEKLSEWKLTHFRVSDVSMAIVLGKLMDAQIKEKLYIDVDGKHWGISSVMTASEPTKTVTLDLKDKPYLKILDIACDQADVFWTISDIIIVYRPNETIHPKPLGVNDPFAPTEEKGE